MNKRKLNSMENKKDNSKNFTNLFETYRNERFGEIRVTEIDGEPLFCLADLCNAIGIVNHRNVKIRLDEEDVHQMDTPTTSGTQLITFVTEAGMYDVILRSDSPKAKPFRKWVTSEVLPSIRKHGAYMTESVQERALQDPDFLIQLATTLKEERNARRLAESRLELEKQINIENTPKVNFANAIVGCKSSCLIGELAKVLAQNGYKTGQNRLFAWMRSHGYLGTKGERYNIPNQQYVEQGLFEIKKGTRSGNDGVMHTTITTKVTTKGQMYFVNKLVHQQDMFL